MTNLVSPFTLETRKQKSVSGDTMLNQEKIVNNLLKFFEKSDTPKVTMDEIASSLKMSKKTIYKYFASKEQLVEAVVWIKIQRVKANVDQIVNGNENAVEKFNSLSNFLLKNGIKFLVIFLDEMAEMGPEWWQKVENFRSKVLFNNFTKILQQGKEEGLIEDMDTEIMRGIYINAIRGIVNPISLKSINKPVPEVIKTVMHILFKGILTEKGIKIYNKIKKENNNEI